MNSEETINELLNLATGLPIIPSTPTGQAIKSAICHIKAWDKVKEEINQKSNDVPIIYNDSDRYEVGLSIAYSDCLDIIDKHLQEVTNCE